MNDFTITASKIDCYKIRNDQYWADIAIDSNGSAGRITIASDFGSWQHFWRGQEGKTFKQFLAIITMDYMADKFKADQHFDIEKTIAEFREWVCEDERLSDEKRKVLNQEIDLLVNFDEEPAFMAFMHYDDDVSTLMEFINHSPEPCTCVSPQFLKFWKTIWPVFMEHLKTEEETITA